MSYNYREPDPARRRQCSALTRLRLYYRDLFEWHGHLRRYAARGGDPPPLLPPSPTRAARFYWVGAPPDPGELNELELDGDGA